MDIIDSADGTPLALHSIGSGDAVVIVGGAMSTAADAAEIAAALAGRGFRAITYDRRARRDSGDTAPYAPEREAEDLAAVIAWAGGDAAVLGHSSGAVLALFAASRGVPVRHLFLSEPPFSFGVDESAPDLPERLQAAVSEGRPDEAITLFQREAVRLPDDVVAQIRQSPMFEGLVPLAQSVVYDATLTRAVATPTDAMLEIREPVTILCGAQTFPMLADAAQRLSAAMPTAELLIMPESVMHRLDPGAAARVIAERLA